MNTVKPLLSILKLCDELGISTLLGRTLHSSNKPSSNSIFLPSFLQCQARVSNLYRCLRMSILPDVVVNMGIQFGCIRPHILNMTISSRRRPSTVVSWSREEPGKLDKFWYKGTALRSWRLKSDTHWIKGWILYKVAEIVR